MKVRIDHEKLLNYPDGKNVISSDDNDILQIKQQLLYGNPTCILVSGYRGTGKTSWVYKLENLIAAEKNLHKPVFFIHLSFNKYEKFSIILRKLIRETAETLNCNQYMKKNLRDILDDLDLLYTKTFFDVDTNELHNLTKETERSLTIDAKLKRLIASVALLLFTSLNTYFTFLSTLFSYISKNFNSILLLLNVLWICFETITYTVKFSKKNTYSFETTKKSLYDDDIAETRILDFLYKLKKEGIKIIYVFDELDKIEDYDKLIKILSEFKTIMLSGSATFIIVSGQRLLYKYASSNYEDDSLISSIFSKQIHIPLLDINLFTSIFSSLIIQDNLLNQSKKENDLLKFYVDTLILRSNRIIRKFLNSINQDIIWEDNISYLFIDDKDLESYKTESMLLNILNDITKLHINEMEYSSGIKDFLIIQSYLWIQKVKIKKDINFTKSDICNLDHDYISYMYFMSELNKLCDYLLNELINANLIQEVNNEENITIYKWNKSAKLKQDEYNINDSEYDFNKTIIRRTDLIRSYSEIENLLRKIYSSIKENGSTEKLKGTNQMIDELKRLKIIDENRNPDLQNLIHIKEEITSIADKDIINNYELYSYMFRKFELAINTNYIYYIIKSTLKDHNYYIPEINEYKFNRILAINDKQKINVYFDFLTKERINKKYISEMIDIVKTKITDGNFIYLIISIFDENEKKYNDILSSLVRKSVFQFSEGYLSTNRKIDHVVFEGYDMELNKNQIADCINKYISNF